jgi:hypothetical protein
MGSQVGRTLLLAAQLSAVSLPSLASPLPQPAAQARAAGLSADVVSSPAEVSAPSRLSRRVRPVSDQANQLLREGAARSAAFAALLDILERSDLIIYITTGGAPGPNHLRLACATGTARFVRIAINAQDAETHLIAGLAHELQHAVEVANAPDVRDDATLVQYYEQHGQEISSGRFCTREAQAAGTTVLNELCLSEGPRPR